MMKDNRVLDIFFRNASMNVINLFFERARKPKDHYETIEAPGHAWGGPGKSIYFTAIITPEQQRTRQEQSRQEYLEQYCENEHVDFDKLEDIITRDSECVLLAGLIRGAPENRLEEAFWGDEQDTDMIIQKSLSDIMKCAEEGPLIRVWHGCDESELCGFYYIVNMLKGCKCEIMDMCLPEYSINRNGEKEKALFWDELSWVGPGAQISHCRILEKEEITDISNKWSGLI